jgi:acyl dehydratase
MDVASLEGETFGPKPMRVCLEKVSEFIDVVGDDRDRWVEAAPPAYLAAALFVVAPELLSQLEGFSVIHGEQTFRWLQPLTMEQDLLVSGTVTRIRERSETYFVSFDMTVTGGDFEVAGGSSLFLIAASTAESGEGPGSPETGPEEDGSPSQSQKSASRTDLVRYAAATRDWNPIHWDHDSARSAGLDGVVAHGLLQAAWALDIASDAIPGIRPFESARIRFRNPLPPATPVDVISERPGAVEVSAGDTVYLTARVEPAEE